MKRLVHYRNQKMTQAHGGAISLKLLRKEEGFIEDYQPDKATID